MNRFNYVFLPKQTLSWVHISRHALHDLEVFDFSSAQ